MPPVRAGDNNINNVVTTEMIFFINGNVLQVWRCAGKS